MFLLYSKKISAWLLAHKNFLGLLFIWIVATSFNLTKPVHIDDTSFLGIGRYIMANPLHPMSGTHIVQETAVPWRYSFHPPLVPAIYGLTFFLFGESEIALHVVMSLFTAISVIFFYFLARQIARSYAFILTSIFILSPTFLPSQNLMLDVPTLSLWLVFFWAILCSDNKEKIVGRYILAGIIVGISALMKYSSLLLILILTVDILWRRRWRLIFVVAIPLIILALWSLFNYFDYGGIHLLTSDKTPIDISTNLISLNINKFIIWLITFGSMAPFSLIFIPWVVKKRSGVFLLSSCIIFTWIFSFYNWQFAEEEKIAYILRQLFLANGLFTFCLVLSIISQNLIKLRVRQAKEEMVTFLILSVWFLTGFIFLTLSVPFIAVRHLLPIMPAAILILGGNLTRQISSRWIFTGVLATVLLGFILALSDWSYADIYRQQAQNISAKIKPRQRGNTTVWFAGHYDWHWYAERQGMKQYDTFRTILQAGDLIVVPTMFGQRINPQHLPFLKTIDQFKIEGKITTIVRLMSNWPINGEGYYYLPSIRSLPWIISTKPLEEFTIYQYVAG